ncbi:hypothetical protein GW17_00034084, partial [Ensete ventricosum]
IILFLKGCPSPLAPICATVAAAAAALHRRRHCTPAAWAAAPATGAAALGWHLAGGRRHLTRALPLLAAAPCGLATSGHPLQEHRGQSLAAATCGRRPATCPFADVALRATDALASWPQPVVLVGVAPTGGRPLRAGLGRGLAVGGRPCMGAGCGWSALHGG